VHVLGGATVAEQAATGSFTINWSAPKERTDGTVLMPAEIGGYRIYYGDTVGHYPYMVEVTGETAASITITDVPAGTIYVVMTTYDTGGRESDFSAVTAKML
jgi:hypothetical protein